MYLESHTHKKQTEIKMFTLHSFSVPQGWHNLCTHQQKLQNSCFFISVQWWWTIHAHSTDKNKNLKHHVSALTSSLFLCSVIVNNSRTHHKYVSLLQQQQNVSVLTSSLFLCSAIAALTAARCSSNFSCSVIMTLTFSTCESFSRKAISSSAFSSSSTLACFLCVLFLRRRSPFTLVICSNWAWSCHKMGNNRVFFFSVPLVHEVS